MYDVVDGDDRRAVLVIRGHGVGNTVAAQLPGVFVAHGDAGFDAGYQKQGHLMEIGGAHVLNGEVHRGHHAGNNDAFHFFHVSAAVVEQVGEDHAVFIAGVHLVGGDAPVMGHGLAFKQSDLDVGVSDIHGKYHSELPHFA